MFQAATTSMCSSYVWIRSWGYRSVVRVYWMGSTLLAKGHGDVRSPDVLCLEKLGQHAGVQVECHWRPRVGCRFCWCMEMTSLLSTVVRERHSTYVERVV